LTALTAVYSSDAHLTPYHLEGRPLCPRINKGDHINEETGEIAVLGTRLLYDVLILDVDGPDHQATDEWFEEQIERLEGSPWGDCAGWYRTRGGYRILWTLAEPLPPAKYLRVLLGLARKLRSYGIIADSLTDWGRVYRLPFVVRDGKEQRFVADFDWLDEPIDIDGLEMSDEQAQSVFAGMGQAKAPLNLKGAIPQNKRNSTLTRVAGGLRRSGFGAEEILGMLRVANATRCDPPLDDRELETIANSVSRYDPEPVVSQTDGDDSEGGPGGINPTAPRFQLGSDVEYADAVCEDLECGGERMVYDRETLWRYAPDMGLWRPIDNNAIHSIFRQYDGEWVVTGVDRNGNPKEAPLKVTTRLMNDVTTMLHRGRYRKGWLDEQTDGIVFADCFIKVTSDGVQRLDFSPEYRQTAGLPFEFIPGREPTRFLQMLEECWQGADDIEARIQLFREWLGAALCNRATVYQKGLILVGGGANGKSTVQEIVKALFPRNTVTAVNPQDMADEYRRAMLAESRLNVVAELPEADILSSEAVKAMISGDLVVGRHIRQAPFEYHPRAAQLFSANSLPGVRDMTPGFWRRWLILEFCREFKEYEQDRHLAGRIISNELPELASWSLEGAAALARRGHYQAPSSSVDAVANWRQTADQVAMFLADRVDTTLDDGATLPDNTWTPSGELYNFYVQWATSAGHKQLSQVKFAKRLSACGLEKRRVAKGVVWACRLRRPSLTLASRPALAGEKVMDVN